MTVRPSRLATCALAMTTACLEPDYHATNVGNQGLVAFDVPRSAIADGTSGLTLAARVDRSFPTVNVSVTFATTTGKFLNGNQSVTVAPDTFGIARAVLTAPRDPSTAFVTATAGGVLKSDTVAFAAALPTGISLVAAPQTFPSDAKPGAESALTATLIRSKGSTSPGGEVQFAIVAVNGMKAELSTDALPTDTEAKAKLVLLTNDKGAITVRARYVRDKTVIVEDDVVIRLP